MEPGAKSCHEGSKGLQRHGAQGWICPLKKRAPALAQPGGLDKMSALEYSESKFGFVLHSTKQSPKKVPIHLVHTIKKDEIIFRQLLISTQNWTPRIMSDIQ